MIFSLQQSKQTSKIYISHYYLLNFRSKLWLASGYCDFSLLFAQFSFKALIGYQSSDWLLQFLIIICSIFIQSSDWLLPKNWCQKLNEWKEYYKPRFIMAKSMNILSILIAIQMQHWKNSFLSQGQLKSTSIFASTSE